MRNAKQVSLAVADTITLLSSVPQEVLSYHILGDQVRIKNGGRPKKFNNRNDTVIICIVWCLYSSLNK